MECKLSKVGNKLANRISTPMTSSYRPELDSLLKPEQANYYQSLIGDGQSNLEESILLLKRENYLVTVLLHGWDIWIRYYTFLHT